MTRFKDKELPSKCQDMTDLVAPAMQFAVEDRYAGIGAQSSCVDQAGRGLREAFCIDLRIEVVRCYFQLWFEAPLLAVWGTRLKKRRNWRNTF